MKFAIHLRKIALLGILGLAILTALSACQSQTTDNTGAPYTGKPTSVTNPTPTPGSGNSSGTTGSTSDIITYKSVDITILSVDQQKSYSEDTSTTPNGLILRVSFKEHNTYSNASYLFYYDAFRLVESNGTQLNPLNVQQNNGVEQAVVRNNWLDFAVASKQDVNTLTLRIGTSTEHQINVPLKSNPDLSQYQPITTNPNTNVQYAGLNLTITQVTAQLSAEAKQATAGNRYIIVTLKADNPTSSDIYPFPSDNFRLKATDVTAAPTDSTLPSSIAAKSTGSTGTIIFLMPDKDTQFTLQFLAQPSHNIAAASANIKI